MANVCAIMQIRRSYARASELVLPRTSPRTRERSAYRRPQHVRTRGNGGTRVFARRLTVIRLVVIPAGKTVVAVVVIYTSGVNGEPLGSPLARQPFSER